MCTLAWGQGSAAGQSAMAQGREERSLRLRAKPGDGDPLLEIMVEIVVTGKLGHLAAFLVEPHPAATLLHVEVLDSHPGGCPDAGEGVAHEPDEGPVPQPEQGSGVDRGQEVVHLLDREHRGFALADAVLRASHRVSGLVCMIWPVTSQSNSIRIAARCCLTVGLAWVRPSCST